MPPFSWFRWLKSLIRPRGKTYRRPRRHLGLEQLETRLSPATSIWSGANAAIDTKWSDGANWQSHLAPNPGDDLVFPSLMGSPPPGAFTPTNDFAAGTTFNSITISGSNYTLGGNALTLGTASSGTVITIGAAATNNQILAGLNINLAGSAATQQTMTVGSGGNLTILSKLSGSSTLTKDDVGTLTLSADNSGFAGAINIAAGILAITSNKALGTTNPGTTVQGSVAPAPCSTCPAPPPTGPGPSPSTATRPSAPAPAT
jgi:autotransporter-associated beta strand protein